MASLAVLPETTRGIQVARNIFDNAVCLAVQFGKLGNSKKIRSAEVDTGNADKSWIKVSKQLLESEILSEIEKGDGAMRRWLYSVSVPSSIFKGVYVVSLDAIAVVDTELEKYRVERATKVAEFQRQYPELLAKAQAALGDKFDVSDYPDATTAAAAFTMDWLPIAFETPGNLAAKNTKMFEEASAKFAEKLSAAAENVEGLLLEEMAELVDHAADKLTPDDDGKKKRFHASLVTNMKDFIEKFKFRNLTGNQELEKIVDQMDALLDGVDPDSLKTQDTVRDRVRQGFESLKETVANAISLRPSRKIVIDE